MKRNLNGGGSQCDTSGLFRKVLPGGTVFDNSTAGKRPLWNVSGVAAYLGVSERTVRDWVYRKVIPYRKAGSSVRFSPDEIERWTLPKQE